MRFINKIIFVITLFYTFSYSQVNFEPTNKSVYNYLDRLSIKGYIHINSEIKPFSRIYIAEKLKIILDNRKFKISELEKKELLFYKKEYTRELYRINYKTNYTNGKKKIKFLKKF